MLTLLLMSSLQLFMYSLATCSLINKYVFYKMQNSLCKMQNTLGKNMPNKICQTQFSTPHAQPCNLLSDTITIKQYAKFNMQKCNIQNKLCKMQNTLNKNQ